MSSKYKYFKGFGAKYEKKNGGKKMFSKGVKKRRHPGVALTVGALAVVGAVSVVKTGKRWMCDTGRRVTCFFKGAAKPMKDDTFDYD